MSIDGIKEMKDFAENTDQLDMFQYWEPQKDERAKSPLDMVKEFADVSGQVPDLSMSLNLIMEEYKEFFNAKNDVEALKELADLVYVCYGFANAAGVDLDMALLRVHDNNMGRMFQEDGSIKRREDGKIMKNPKYPKVDLRDLV